MIAPLLPNEQQRLAALRSLDLLDTPPEPEFDRITKLLARSLQVPITLVSLVDESRQWFKSKVGLDVRETHRDHAFCAHTILQDSPLVVPDAQLDPRFADNRLVMDAPNIRFYAGAPIRSSSGHRLGTLCAIDSKPHNLSQEELDTLCDLAALVSNEIRLRERLSSTSDRLERSRDVARANEAHYRSMFELASVGIAIVAANGAWISVNDALCKIVGYRADELMGLTFQDITHPDDLSTDLLLLGQLIDDKIDHYHMEKRYLRKDGRPVWIDLGVTKKTDDAGRIEYFVSIVKDIDSQKVAEERLIALQRGLESKVEARTAELLESNGRLIKAIDQQRDSERQLRKREAELRTVLENAYDAYIALDQAGLVTAWNREAENIFGWQMGEAIGRPLEDLIVPLSMAEMHRSGVSRYRAGGLTRMLDQRLEIPARRKDGSTLTVEARIKALDIDGQIIYSAFLHDITERKDAEIRREHEARQDALTGLYNRRALAEMLPRAIARADRSGKHLGLLFLDLDGFKEVNDSFGHEAGDRVLCRVATEIKKCIRQTDSAVRFAGDEFAVVLEGLIAGYPDALRVAEKILEAISASWKYNNHEVQVGASIGVVVHIPGEEQSPAALLKEADHWMYRAKHAGKGCVLSPYFK
ncbi:sensor domain-containing diguanylate cyclase [Zoogloea dura]|uniref:PAS domain S-box protein n=1 Tax=Zoogloea dura TaxID=2728840 RepID=A0A848FZG7_9RHOO|nr:PAS domain S-box protein [Zoogloea dura]NML24422.1 PAS domain S-box protein [Zoogloea dura]